MRRILNKLKGRQGTTILFALLVFLLCILTGTAALTAAAANAGRYTHLESDQQKYLSVSSATDLLRGQLSGQRFEAKIIFEEKYEWWYEPVDETESSDSEGTEEGTEPSAAADLPESAPAEETEPPEYKLKAKTTYTLNEPIYKYGSADGEDMSETGADASLLGSLMKDYLQNMFLYSVVPEEWFETEKTEGAEGEGGETAAEETFKFDIGASRPAEQPISPTMTLSVTGEGDLAKKLSPVKAKLAVQNGGYSLTLEQLGADTDPESEDDKLLYTASVQIPAVTESASETNVEVSVTTPSEEDGTGETSEDTPTPASEEVDKFKEKGTRTTTTALIFSVTWNAEGVKITRIKGGTTDAP